jgi:N-methylhydantoinase A
VGLVSPNGNARGAVDVGGTFTDAITVDPSTGELIQRKSLTTYPDPTQGFVNALAKLPIDLFEYVGYGTTLATNAVLTRSGARTALLTTRGFRDVLEIRRTHRKKLFDLYEEIPPPIVERPLRKEVAERIDATGRVIEPLDEAEVAAIARELRAVGVEAIAVCYLFSFLNPHHEIKTRQVLEKVLPEVRGNIALSSEVLPLHREYERTSTTVLNASLMPLIRRYFTNLETELRNKGHVEWLQVMQSTGGLVRPDRAGSLPILTLLSGPAGGAIGSAFLGDQLGESKLLTLDMGGTSCDVTGILEGAPDTRIDFEIGGYSVSYPTIDVHTVGAGGGSIASVDRFGHLSVGPQSAGARPGPACYGLGGKDPTVTDANLVLGLYDGDLPLGGEVELDLNRARAAIERGVAAPLGLSVDDAAAGIVRIVNAHMTHALRAVSVERGRDPRDYALVSFGGAGPVHGAAIAEALAIRRVIVPPIPGCHSAFGILTSDVRHDLVETFRAQLTQIEPSALGAMLSRLEGEASRLLHGDKIDSSKRRIVPSLDVRYVGQAYEINVPIASTKPSSTHVQAVAEAFHRLHEQRYGHSFEDDLIEVVNVRVVGVGSTPKPALGKRRPHGRAGLPYDRRKLLTPSGEVVEGAFYKRDELVSGQGLETPCVIHQLDATTFVPPGWGVVVHDSGALVLEHL